MTEGFFMRPESFFNFASYIDQVSTLKRYGGRRLHEQSHGESFLALFANRFDRGIYVLDEPEAALSPQRQLAFLKVIDDLEATGQAQFLIASHSPILLAYPWFRNLNLDDVRWPEDADHIVVSNYKVVLDRMLNFLRNRTESPAKGLTALLEHARKWAGPKQYRGVFNKLDLIESGSEALTQELLKICGLPAN